MNAQVSGPPVATNKLPDLVVKKISYGSPADKIMVEVKNEGGGASATCYLALRSGAVENPALGAKRVWSVSIPSLATGQTYSTEIVVSPLTISDGPWKAVVDRSNVVKESNESNNQLDYEVKAGGTVLLLPDLQITNATLTNATTGEVTVEVSNTEGAPAGEATLRLIVWKMGKFEKEDAKTVFIKVPGVGAKQKVNVKVTAGVPIISTKYSLFIDISHDVKEKNEENNRFEGEAVKS